MTKCLVFLYPIISYFYMYERQDNQLLSELNDTIYKRYKSKGYKVFVTLFSDTNLYGISQPNIDGIIDVKMNFKKFVDIKDKISIDEIVFPDLDKMFRDILNYDQIVVTGFHYKSCVRRALEYLLNKNKNASIDLDLTENFSCVHNSIFFNKEIYNPENFKKCMIDYFSKRQTLEESEHEFDIAFNCPLFGFSSNYIPDDPKSIEVYLKRADESVIKNFIIKRFRELKIDDYDIDIYLKLLILISKRLKFQGPDLLFLIYEVLNELEIIDKPKVVDNIFKLLGYTSSLVLCNLNGYEEIVNIYYPIHGSKHPLVIYDSNHSIRFINYNGNVIKCPLFIPLSQINSERFQSGEKIKCNVDSVVNMARKTLGISNKFEADLKKLSYTWKSKIDIEKD